MRVIRCAIGSLLLVLTLCTGGCIPYTVGTTAQTAPPGKAESSLSTYIVPDGLDIDADDPDTESVSYMAVDAEIRYGLDSLSDIGARFPGASGIIINYKRRLLNTPDGAPGRLMLSGMAGAGFVNFGNHAHFEATVIASGWHSRTLTPYGGLRAMHVLPLSDSAVRDSPTLGGFFGVRIGSREFRIVPEVGVYYDEPALGISSRSWYVIPSVTLQAPGLLERLVPGPRF